jgi:signal transduction histidine kinase/CheY-like chemotaxis protein/HPt (histidine-containing phosphotransfer) domain-containing protein
LKPSSSLFSEVFLSFAKGMNGHSLTFMKQNTSFKIACGYFLLICLLLGSIYYIYHQTTSLTRMSGNEQTLAERRKVTHQLVSQLYETENIGQAVHFGRWEAYRKYVQSMSNVQQTISALDTLFTDSLQKARLDTLSSLLTGKQENMKRLVLTLENNSAPQIYQHQISLLVKSQDTVIQKPHITRQIIQKDKSYTVKEPKKNFFQRLASAFHKPEADTTAVKQTVQILETDTIHQEFNARDTLAHILDSIESSMKQYNSRRRQRINAQAERLWYTSLELNNRVTQLLESIEKEEQQRLEEESRKAYMVRKQAALTTGLIATAAILLAIVFFVIVWRDITKSNHYRHELEKSKKRAEDLLVSREKLMLTVTHDIKAPVGSIMGYTELLVPYVRENRPKNYLDNIRSSSEHLLSLVGSLLDYHKLEAHKMDLHPVSFSPDELLRTIAQSFLPMAEKKGLALQFETSPETRRTYTGDAFRIRQITDNLLSNALKFTRQGHILLRAKMHGRLLCITVRDTGCGMTAEEQQMIFKEFTRLSSAQGEEGVGLGLSITLKLVQLLQGEIHLESTLGKGTSFFVTLPLQLTHKKQVPVAEAPATLESVERPLHILLIDDDRIQMQLTQAMLQQIQPEKADWEIVSCRTPEEVFHRVGQCRFDLLFTDIQMPSMNGFELLKKVRALNPPAHAQLPVVAITARNDMQEAFFREHGFATCLYKPFNQKDLAQAIRKALGEACPEVKEAPGKPEVAPSQTSPAIDLEPLTEFAGDDRNAAQEILNTFLQETLLHAKAFKKAYEQKDKAEICRIAHKLLPTFTLVGAPCIKALRTLEQQRDEQVWDDTDNVPAQEVIESFHLIVRALKEKNGSGPAHQHEY